MAVKYKQLKPRVYSSRTAKTMKKFKNFNSLVVRGSGNLATAIKNSSALKNAIKSVFSRKGVILAAGTTAIGFGAKSIMDYIDANSGCFQVSALTGKTECKVLNLSCCYKTANKYVPYCTQQFADPCGAQFDEEKENSCCRLCDCKSSNCAPGKELECRRATVGEALSFFFGELFTPVKGIIFNVLAVAVAGTFGLLLVTWLVRYLFSGGGGGGGGQLTGIVALPPFLRGKRNAKRQELDFLLDDDNEEEKEKAKG